MRRGGALVLTLVCISLGGCLTGDPARPASWLDRLRSPRTALGPDGILMDLVLLEQPLADPFVNDEVWKNTDCQIVGLERKGILDDNGFRVGQVVGMNPSRLQSLLESQRAWAGHRRQVLPTGGTTAMALGPTLPQCSFRLRTVDGGFDVLLDQGQCVLKIEPSLVADGRINLKFTPQVMYGAQIPDYQVAPDKSGWLLEFKRLSKTYPELSWEVTLQPNQYLVIGSHFDSETDDNAPQTLGSQFLIQDNGQTFVQRLLVLRACCGKDDGSARPELAAPGITPSAAGHPAEPGQPLPPAAQCLQ
jgi:hypothetical protein